MLARLTALYAILRALVLVLGAVVYCLSPIDVVPDALPIAGWLDDLAILAAGLSALYSALKPSPPAPPPSVSS